MLLQSNRPLSVSRQLLELGSLNGRTRLNSSRESGEKRLRKWRASSHRWPLEIDGEGRDHQDGADTCKNGIGDLERKMAMEGVIVWACTPRQNSRQEVARESIAASSRCRIGTVGRYHVVDRSHVDGVVRNPDEHTPDHGQDPMNRSRARPGEYEQADRKARGGIE